MQTHHTTRHIFGKVDYMNIPTYESGSIAITDETSRLEIQGITPEQLNEAIKSYVAACGYHTSAKEMTRTSGFLSELADVVAKAQGRLNKELDKALD